MSLLFGKPKKIKKVRKLIKDKGISPEKILQNQTNSYLDALGIYYVRISDAIYRIFSNPGISPHIKKEMKASISGLPDNNIQIPINNKFYLGCNVELKNSIGKFTADQKRRSREVPYVVIRTFEEMEELVKEIGIVLDKIKKVDTLELKKYKDKFSEYTYYLKDGEEVRHGLCKRYYGNGKIRIEYNYKDGKIHGLFKYYYEDGELKWEDNWKNGVSHGLCKYYYENGELECEYNWENGILII